MQGISIKPTIGIGDALQFSSLPENYFLETGVKLLDVSRPWFFDHNPFVVRSDDHKPTKVTELWNFSPKQWEFPKPRETGKPNVYLSNAEIWASLFGVPVKLNRPRLYQFENTTPFEKRSRILLHTDGVSHGAMPAHIVEHVVKKYGPTNQLYLIGKNTPNIGLPVIHTPTLWDLARELSQARMLIGLDSGPSWVAACYPDVIVKKVRTKPQSVDFAKWVPLEIANIHSHWDDRCHQVFNTTETDVGFTSSYRKI